MNADLPNGAPREGSAFVQLVSDAATYVASRALPGAATALLGLLLIRVVGPAQYGRYSIASGVALIAATLAVSWLTQSQLRFARDDRASASYRATVTIGTRIALGVALVGAAASCAVVVGVDSPVSALVVAVYVALAVVYAFHTVCITSLQSDLRPGATVRAELARSVAIVVLPTSLARFGSPTDWSVALGVAGSYAVGAFVASRESGRARVHVEAARTARTEPSHLGVFFAFGWPLSVWLATSLAFQFLDRELLALKLGAATAGNYVCLFDCVTRPNSLLLLPITLALHPRFVSAGSHQHGSKSLLLQAVGLQLALAVPIGAAWIFFGTPIVKRLIPTLEPATAPLAGVCACAGLAWQVALLAHKPLEAAGRTRTMLAMILLALVGHATFLVVAIPRIGVAAAPIGELASALAYVGLCVVVSLRLPSRSAS